MCVSGTLWGLMQRGCTRLACLCCWTTVEEEDEEEEIALEELEMVRDMVLVFFWMLHTHTHTHRDPKTVCNHTVVPKSFQCLNILRKIMYWFH